MIVSKDSAHVGRISVSMSEREFAKLQALFWTVQNTVLESLDVQNELEENLQFLGIGNEYNRDMSRRLNFDKLFRHIIDTAVL